MIQSQNNDDVIGINLGNDCIRAKDYDLCRHVILSTLV